MTKNLQRFFQNDVAGGVCLIIAAILAILFANIPLTRSAYQAFLATPVEVRIGLLDINKNLLLWVNDALMAVFFLMVGLEVKREMVQGSLAHRRQAALPLIAALGGMIFPALLYLAFNFSDPVMREGWAIPTATDIAFALGILALLGNRIPVALKVFLMALAIIDDLGAIVIIALFYTSQLSLLSLSVAVAAIAMLALMNRFNIRRTGLYILVGVILWTAVLKSGVHATLAGVILGFFIPLQEQHGRSPAEELTRILHPWVAFLILPLFAFANAGIVLSDLTVHALGSALPLGIMVGLFIGKPLGISLFCGLALKLQLVSLPKGTQFRDIMAVGILCGIGFTMSIFITSLAFGEQDSELITLAKLGILLGSLLSAVIGYRLLKARFSMA